MLVVGVVLVVLVLRMGSQLDAPAPALGSSGFNPGAASVHSRGVGGVLLALPVIMLAAWMFGIAFRRLGQPAVIGEIVAGIVLGPSILGRAWPAATEFLWTGPVPSQLQTIAQLGVILFMFLVGLEVNARLLRKCAGPIITVSHASIVVPWVLGCALALWLYPRYSSNQVPFTVFSLFVGVSLSVTALPVLARILADRGIQGTPLGTLTLGCAAVSDATAWCLLALVVGMARAQASEAVATVGLVLAFVLAMLFVVRPVIGRMVSRAEQTGRVSRDVTAVVVMAVLLCALATDAIGIHALFGSFLLGAIVRHDSVFARGLQSRLSDLVLVLFLPVFFAYVGLRTQIGLLSSAEDWLVCALIVLVACVGKLAGTALAALAVGLSWRGAATIGVLMNTRGLMELIVLNVGLELGVLSPKLFAMLIIMAIVTTMLTSPVLTWLIRGRGRSALSESLGTEPQGAITPAHSQTQAPPLPLERLPPPRL